jgi:predicted Zn finger-like uncharacterized protein
MITGALWEARNPWILFLEPHMSIQAQCPSCGASYSVADDLGGKSIRCKRCEQRFEVVIAVSRAPVDVSAPHVKKGRHEDALASVNLKLGLLGVGLLVVVGGCIALLLYATRGGGPSLVGTWKGAPEVRQAVGEFAKGKNVNPLAEGFAKALIQKAADELMSTTITFKNSGTAFFSGNTEALGLPAESDSPWEILRSEGDFVTVKMGRADKSFEARLAFKDANSFTLTRLDKKDFEPILFKRQSN